MWRRFGRLPRVVSRGRQAYSVVEAPRIDDPKIQALERQLAGALEDLRLVETAKGWGPDVRSAEQRITELQGKLRVARRARLVRRTGMTPQPRQRKGKPRSSSSPSRARIPVARGLRRRRANRRHGQDDRPGASSSRTTRGAAAKNKVEESGAIGQKELVKFLRALLDVVETMVVLNQRAGSDRHRTEARGRAIRALEIVAQFTPRIRDNLLVQRIQTIVAHYARMLECGRGG